MPPLMELVGSFGFSWTARLVLAGLCVDHNCPYTAFRRGIRTLDHAIVGPSIRNFSRMFSEILNPSQEAGLEFDFLMAVIHDLKNLLLHISHDPLQWKTE